MAPYAKHMKIVIQPGDSPPQGEYELTDREKLDRVKRKLALGSSDRDILVAYDGIGGRLIKDGQVLLPQSL